MVAGVTQPLGISQPNYHRAYANTGGSDVDIGYVLKHAGTAGECELSTDPTDTFVGVSVEKLTANGPTRSVQSFGRVPVKAGGSFSAGARLTVDSQGRVIEATPTLASPQNIVGRAETASTGADEWVEVELGDSGRAFSSISSVADIAAAKALAASDRWDGQLILVKSNNSLWRVDTSATGTEDAAQELLLSFDAGAGRLVRADKAFTLKVPIDFSMADAEVAELIPAGFTLNLIGYPYYEIKTAFTGGTSSAIGVSTSITNYDTKGDIIGGASGDVAAGLTAGIRRGTQGGELNDLTGFFDLLLVAGTELRYDRIVDAFTAGEGFVCLPVTQAIDAP